MYTYIFSKTACLSHCCLMTPCSSGSALVQIMACCLTPVRPSSEPVVTFHRVCGIHMRASSKGILRLLFCKISLSPILILIYESDVTHLTGSMHWYIIESIANFKTVDYIAYENNSTVKSKPSTRSRSIPLPFIMHHSGLTLQMNSRWSKGFDDWPLARRRQLGLFGILEY